MPVFNFLFWTKESGDTLESSGPLVQVEITLPAPLEEFYVKQGIALPPPASGYALIDTGASASAVDEQELLRLGVLPIDSIPTHTPHGEARSFVYPARISFPGMVLQHIPMNRVIGCNLSWQTPDAKKVIMLVGRDLLKYFLMIYHGEGSSVTLSY